MEISFGQIVFSSKFDSGNLARVEQICKTEDQKLDGYFENIDYVFNLWTSPDASGTSYENGNRTWFYFSICGPLASRSVKFTVMNMNRQGRLYRQGLTPFYKSVSARVSSWQRIKEKPTFETVDDNFQLTFIHKFADSTKHSITYFAFCYPFSYVDCQKYISNLQRTYSMLSEVLSQYQEQDIYFHRDTLTRSIDGLNVDLLTVTSMKGITEHHEKTILGIYPDKSLKRAKIFKGKKIFFLTSRVHPGETQASYVFNGFLDFILRKDDKRAATLRDLFVFKMVPMLNPDGVKRGHYRTDTFGVNLNRTYIEPDMFKQPTIFAIKTLMFYHHFNRTDPKLCSQKLKSSTSDNVVRTSPDDGTMNKELRKSSTLPCLTHSQSEKVPSKSEENKDRLFTKSDQIVMDSREEVVLISKEYRTDLSVYDLSIDEESNNLDSDNVKNSEVLTHLQTGIEELKITENSHEKIIEKEKFDDGIDFYIDLHGHASKRGCFVYGNYIEEEKGMVECMLYPKLISLNSSHFDFSGCDFSERNMYHKDKRDGLSKEGSGRVSMFKGLGLIHSYTLECNYNTGRTTNLISPATGDDGRATPPPTPGFPPRYTLEHYEEVGRATAIALLDYYNCNPWSRLPASEYKSLTGVREWITKYIQNPPAKNFAQAKSLKQNKSPIKMNQVFQEFRKSSSQTLVKQPTTTTSSVTTLAKPRVCSPPKNCFPTKVNIADIAATTFSSTKYKRAKPKHPPLKLFQHILPKHKIANGDTNSSSNHNNNNNNNNNSNSDHFSLNNLATSEKHLENKTILPKEKLPSAKKLLSERLSMEKPYAKARSGSIFDEKVFNEENRLSAVSCKLRSPEFVTKKNKNCSPIKISKKKTETLKASFHSVDLCISSKLKSSSDESEKKDVEKISTTKKKSNREKKKSHKKQQTATATQ